MTKIKPIKSSPIAVIGMNPNTPLDLIRLETLLGADVIYTSQRHQELLHAQRPNLQANWHFWQSPLQNSLDSLANDHQSGKSVTVVASGDPLCHGIAATIIQHFPDFAINIIPAPSSFSLAAAAMRWPLQNCRCVSLHNSDEQQILHEVTKSSRLLCLTNNQHSPQHIAQILQQHGWGTSRLTVLEELGGEQERIRSYSAEILSQEIVEFHSLNLLALEPKRQKPATWDTGLFPEDSAFIHDGQFTKFGFRAITLAALNPAIDRLLWDIGSGSGAVAIGWIKLGGRAVAIERHPQRCTYIQQNAEFSTSVHLELLQEDAKTCLTTLQESHEAPDAIFFGGALSLIESAMPLLKSSGCLVANAVTIESQQYLFALRKKYGGILRRISLEEEDSIAMHIALKPLRSLVQYKWCKS